MTGMLLQRFCQEIPTSLAKKHTISIEQDNSNTRNHLGRMTRRTKIVIRSEEMIYLSMTLWYALNTLEIFRGFPQIFISVYNLTLSKQDLVEAVLFHITEKHEIILIFDSVNLLNISNLDMIASFILC